MVTLRVRVPPRGQEKTNARDQEKEEKKREKEISEKEILEKDRAREVPRKKRERGQIDEKYLMENDNLWTNERFPSNFLLREKDEEKNTLTPVARTEGGKRGMEEDMGSSKKKLYKGHFRIMWPAWSKKNFCNEILRQRTTSVQIFKIFGCHQNHGY